MCSVIGKLSCINIRRVCSVDSYRAGWSTNNKLPQPPLAAIFTTVFGNLPTRPQYRLFK